MGCPCHAVVRTQGRWLHCVLFFCCFVFTCLSSLRQHVVSNNRDCELRRVFGRPECCQRDFPARMAVIGKAHEDWEVRISAGTWEVEGRLVLVRQTFNEEVCERKVKDAANPFVPEGIFHLCSYLAGRHERVASRVDG